MEVSPFLLENVGAYKKLGFDESVRHDMGKKMCFLEKSFSGVDMMVPPLSSSEMDITMLMAKVDMVFSRLDTNKAQLRFERHMRVHKLFLNMRAERNQSRQWHWQC